MKNKPDIRRARRAEDAAFMILGCAGLAAISVAVVAGGNLLTRNNRAVATALRAKPTISHATLPPSTR